jgi:hypothetical protein
LLGYLLVSWRYTILGRRLLLLRSLLGLRRRGRMHLLVMNRRLLIVAILVGHGRHGLLLVHLRRILVASGWRRWRRLGVDVRVTSVVWMLHRRSMLLVVVGVVDRLRLRRRSTPGWLGIVTLWWRWCSVMRHVCWGRRRSHSMRRHMRVSRWLRRTIRLLLLGLVLLRGRWRGSCLLSLRTLARVAVLLLRLLRNGLLRLRLLLLLVETVDAPVVAAVHCRRLAHGHHALHRPIGSGKSGAGCCSWRGWNRRAESWVSDCHRRPWLLRLLRRLRNGTHRRRTAEGQSIISSTPLQLPRRTVVFVVFIIVHGERD